jgi:hypothetical protein
MGVSPATGPTPNKGFEAAGMQKLGTVINQLTDLLPMVGATSELGQAVMKALQSFSKHLPPGSVSPAGQQNNMQQMMLQQQKNASMLQQMKPGAQQGGQAPPPMPQAA